jgi:hypothetical protein
MLDRFGHMRGNTFAAGFKTVVRTPDKYDTICFNALLATAPRPVSMPWQHGHACNAIRTWIGDSR